MAQDSIKIRELPATGVPPTSSDYVVVESLVGGTKKSTIGNLNFSSQNFNDGSISGSKIANDIAGSGLTKTGPNLAVNPDNSTVEVVANKIQVKPGGLSGSSLADGSIPLVKIKSVPTDPNKTLLDISDAVIIKDGTDGLTKTVTMDDFASSVVASLSGGTITSDTTLNVGSGEIYPTLQDAITFLQDKNIAATANVTINMVAGQHTIASTVVIDHPDAQRITIQGQPLVPLSIVSYAASPNVGNQIVTSSGDNTAGYEVTLQLNPGGTTGLAVGDYIGVEFYENSRAIPIGRWGNGTNNTNTFVLFPSIGAGGLNTGDIIALHHGFSGAQRGNVKILDYQAGVATGQPGGLKANIGSPTTGLPMNTAVYSMPHIDVNRGGEPAAFASGPSPRHSDRAAKCYIIKNGASNMKGSLSGSAGSNVITWNPPGSGYVDLRNFLNVGDVISGGHIVLRVSKILSATQFEISTTLAYPLTLSNAGEINTNPACVNGCVRISDINVSLNQIKVQYFIRFNASPWPTFNDGNATYSGNAANASYLQSSNLPFPKNGFKIRAWKFPTIVQTNLSTGQYDAISTGSLGAIKDLACVSDVVGFATKDAKFINAGDINDRKYKEGIRLGNIGVSGMRGLTSAHGLQNSTIEGTNFWMSNSMGTPLALGSGSIMRAAGSIYVNGVYSTSGSSGVSLFDQAGMIRNSSTASLTVNGVFGVNSTVLNQFTFGDGIAVVSGSALTWDPGFDTDGLYVSQVARTGLYCARGSTLTAPTCMITATGLYIVLVDDGANALIPRSVFAGSVNEHCLHATQNSRIQAHTSIGSACRGYLAVANRCSSILVADSIFTFTQDGGLFAIGGSSIAADRCAIGFVPNTAVYATNHSYIGAQGMEVLGVGRAVAAIRHSQISADSIWLSTGASALEAYEVSCIDFFSDVVAGAITPQTQPTIGGFTNATPIIAGHNSIILIPGATSLPPSSPAVNIEGSSGAYVLNN